MSEPRFVTTGPVGGSPNRLEINDFVKKEKFFSLYIQALQIISKQDQNNIQSFFQLGGIHGLPYIPWDGVVGNPPFKDPSDANWGGYCTHASVLFPTWHRPYVMLYEQILQQRAIEIAATYHTVDKEAWKQAALDLRQPFWDWAKNAVPPDEVIALKQVTIVGPDGKHVTVDNPLYHYAFHPLDPSYEFPTPFSGWQTTLRHPTSQEPDASDDVTALRNVLSAAQTNITTNTYNMLTRISTWPAFSNDTVGDDGSTSNSVEAIHNNIHFNVGGVPAGHMGNAAVAGFDPIFYLHHANVDRLLSLWSALHPGVWVSPGSSEKGTFTIPPGVTIDQTTVLTPFWNSQTTFWASSAVENTSKLGYTYPDFNGLDLGNTDAVRTAIGNRVNQLYGTSISGLLAAAIPAAKESSLPAQVINPLRGLVTQTVAQTQSIIQSILPPNLGLWDWTARIQFKKFEVGTSFAVLLFLGHVPENSEEWRVSRNYVGAHYAFVNSAAERCANCLNQQDVVIEGFVHLNLAIALLSGLGSLIPEVIKPYLTEFLHWRILRSDGAVVELKSLEVSVFATPLSYPSGAIFPVPGVASRIDDITHGKIGGLSLPI